MALLKRKVKKKEPEILEPVTALSANVGNFLRGQDKEISASGDGCLIKETE